jgi:hypothetical protein
MAYDILRQRVVLFGGSSPATAFADTWEWDGVNWIQRTPATSPFARSSHALAYDLTRQRVILFGFQSSGGRNPPPPDTWEWDGSNWLQLSPASSPAPRERTAMAYDLLRQRVVLFGGLHCSGFSSCTVFGDTWTLGHQVPAATQTVGSGCAGTSGPPLLVGGAPFLGNPSFRLDLHSARASSPCVLVLANGTQTLQLGGGCTLYLLGDPVPLSTATNSSGFASVRLMVPPEVALRGATVYAQGFVVDPMGPFAGLAFSAGLRIVLGD